jgi:hypothetical protein
MNDFYTDKKVFTKMLKSFLLYVFISNLVVLCLFGCGSVSSSPSVTDGSDENGGTGGIIVDPSPSNSLRVQDKTFTTSSTQELKVNLSALVNNLSADKKYSYVIVSLNNLGLVAIQNETLTYTPTLTGSDEIQYKVSDGSLTSNIGKVTILVSATTSSIGSSDLVLNNGTLTLNENEAKQFNLSTMIKGFNSSAQYNFAFTSLPTIGTISLSGFTLTYTPNAGRIGTDSIELRAGDGNSTSNIATIAVTIKDLASSAPELNDTIIYTIKPNITTSLDLNLLFKPPHPFPNKTYTFSITRSGVLGTGVINGRTLDYTPKKDAVGTTDTSMRVRVVDNLGQSSEIGLTVKTSSN